MGVQDLSKELRASKKLVTNLSDYSEKILGVDASIWLNKAIFASTEISLLFHQEPRVTVGHLIDQFFDRLLSVFEVGSDTTDFPDFASDYGQLFFRSDRFRLLAITPLI